MGDVLHLYTEGPGGGDSEGVQDGYEQPGVCERAEQWL